MATDALKHTQHVPQNVESVTQNAPETISSSTTGALSTLDALSNNIGTWAQDILDRFFPSEQRQALLAKIKAFVLANPKVSAFLGMNIALAGIPLGLFTLFGLSVAVFSVLGGIIAGILGAVFFTLFCVGIALTILLPVLMFTTGSACFLFLFGLGGYKILKWANSQDQNGDNGNGEKKGTTVGEGLDSLTGGRLTDLLDSAEAQREKNDIKSFSNENAPPSNPEAPKLRKEPPKISETSKATASTPQNTMANKAPSSTSTSISLSPIAQKRRADQRKAGCH